MRTRRARWRRRLDKQKKRHYSSLLRVRERQQDLEAQRLAVAQREVLRAETELADIERQQRMALEGASQASGRRPEPPKITGFLQYERHLSRTAVQKDAEIRTLQTKAEAQRSKLEDAMKRRKTMERLLEKTQESLDAEQRRREQRLSDEAASVRHRVRETAEASRLES